MLLAQGKRAAAGSGESQGTRRCWRMAQMTQTAAKGSSTCRAAGRSSGTPFCSRGHWVPQNPHGIRKELIHRERSYKSSRTESVRRVGTGGSTEPPGARGQVQKGRRQDPRCWEKVTVRSMSLGEEEEEWCHRDGAPNWCLCTTGMPRSHGEGTYSRATPQLAEQREAASL